MNRRQLIMLSGTAAVAAQALAQTRQTTGLSASGPSQRASYKALLKLSRSKSSYKIPKTDTKRAKYVRALSAALSLTPGQQQQVEEILANAQTRGGPAVKNWMPESKECNQCPVVDGR